MTDDHRDDAPDTKPIDEPRASQADEGELDPQTVAKLAEWFGAPATSLEAPTHPGSTAYDASGPKPRDEPRAGQVVRGEVPEEELDPQTVAQLAAWFGAPATSLEPANEPAGSLEREHREWLEGHAERLAAVEAATDPTLRARLEALTTGGDDFIRLPEPMHLPIERRLTLSDVDAWSMIVVETRDWERPDEVVDGLKESVPQAVLRDLFRPVLEWPLILLPTDVGAGMGAGDSMDHIRELMYKSQRVAMGEMVMASVAGRRLLAELQEQMDEPWDEIEIPEDRKAGGSPSRTPDDFIWFGSVGYDPTI